MVVQTDGNVNIFSGLLPGELSPKPQPHGRDKTSIVLEGYLTKQGSRAKNFWHDRFFTLSAEGILVYYTKKEDAAPKATLPLNQLQDCEISELYVARGKNREMLYCVKITWSVPHGGNTMAGDTDGNNVHGSDNESVLSAPTVIMEGDTFGNECSGSVTDGNASVASQERGATKKRRGIFRKNKQRSLSRSNSHQNLQLSNGNEQNEQQPKAANCRPSTATLPVHKSPPRNKKENKGYNDSSNTNTPVAVRSIDGESLTIGTRRRPSTPSLAGAPSADESESMPRIPAMVEVQGENLFFPTHPADSDSETLTVRAGNNNPNTRTTTLVHKPYETEEMVYLRSQFLAVEKEKKRVTKRKVAEGVKFAAAAGAAVGVAVLTVGIGLMAGLVALGIGAAAGASGTATGVVWKKKRDGVIVMGTTDYEKMRRWKACLDASLNSGIIQKSRWGQLFVGEGNKRRMLIFPKGNDLFAGTNKLTHQANLANDGRSTRGAGNPVMSPRDGGQIFENAAAAKWKPLEGGWTSFLGTGPQGLRIFREEQLPGDIAQGRRHMLFRGLSVDERPCPPMKSHLVLNATPLDAFLCLMSQGQLPLEANRRGDAAPTVLAPNSGQRSSFRIIESIDDNTDVIHMVCSPLYLLPSWTTPRDFVLYRYWRLEEDGSFIVCFESVHHKDCPPHSGYCRGEMHQLITVAPHKNTQRRKGGSGGKDQLHECLMTAVVQVDPKGWVPITSLSFLTNQGYGDAFAVAALMQLLDVRDAIDQDRFVPVSLDDGIPATTATSWSFVDPKFSNLSISRNDSMGSEEYRQDLVNYDYYYAGREATRPEDSPTGLASTPLPLIPDAWAEPDANSFRVRGKTYLEDRLKINSGASIGRLVAVDVVQVDAPIYSGMTAHPTERVQLALKKEKVLKAKGLDSDMPPYLFVVNIVLPGPPFYHGVFYYAIDNMSTIDGSNGEPSSKLCKEFIFGDSDTFRDRTFKLIPQIVQGNFIVRKAVGSTPAIMGKKLRQFYVRTERSFEVVLDCGSSPVATGVIRLSLGYAKTLVVDMAFLFEGGDEDHLPERLMGCARVRNLDFGPYLRKVEQPPSLELAKSPVPPP